MQKENYQNIIRIFLSAVFLWEGISSVIINSVALLQTAEQSIGFLVEVVLTIPYGIAVTIIGVGVWLGARFVKFLLLFLCLQNFIQAVFIFNLFGFTSAVLWNGLAIVLIGLYLSTDWNRTATRAPLAVGAILLIILLPKSLLISLSLFVPDQPPLPYDELLLTTVEVLPAQDNSYVLLRPEIPLSTAAEEALDSSLSDVRTQDQASALLAQIQPELKRLSDAAKAPGYQCPSTVNTFSNDAEYCALNQVRMFGSLGIFAAQTARENNDIPLAIQNVTVVAQLGKQIVQGENVSSIEYLVGMALLGMSQAEYTHLLDVDGALSVTQQASIEDALSVGSQTIVPPLRREFTLWQESIYGFPQQKNYLFHPNRTRNAQYNYYEALVKRAEAGCLGVKPLQVEILDPLHLLILKPNFIGNIFNSVIVGSQLDLLTIVCEYNQLQEEIR